MAKLVMKNKTYKTKVALYNVLAYIVENSESLGGCGISISSTNIIYCEFEAIKRIWMKPEEGKRQVKHFYVSFGRKEIGYKMVLQIAWTIAEYYGKRYQVLYGIHTDTANLHIHYAINTVSFVDGKMLSEGYDDFQKLNNEIQEIVRDYKKCYKSKLHRTCS